jgi:5-dehydro-2-deoxygluconokinase
VVETATIARAIRRLYAIGIRPDWWKLEPISDPAAWREIEAAVTEEDPFCRGVVVLGLSAPEPELIASFDAAAPFSVVKGFAVGRTIFYDAAREWLAGRIDSRAAVEDMSGRLSLLAQAWRRARGARDAAA